MQACHEFETDGKKEKILHRDIKPGNIFLDKNFNVKLGDFGLSKTLNPDIVYTSTNVGTPYYMAPEQVSSSKYDDKVDIWSLGIVIYQMCTLSVPFKGGNYFDLAQKIATETIKPLPKIYSERLKNVVKALLHKDPKKRPTAKDLCDYSEIKYIEWECTLKDRERALKTEKENFYAKIGKKITYNYNL